MKYTIFNEKIATLINDAINYHKQYEEFHKSMYNDYLEYDNPNTTKERRLEISKLMRKGDPYLENYNNTILELGKSLNSHDFDIAMRKVDKKIVRDADLWNDYFKWKSTRSTMVV